MYGASFQPGQAGLPGFVPDLIAVAGTLVLLLLLTALVGFVYKSLTGGIEWPEDDPNDEDALQQGDQDDEWDFY